MKNNAMKYVLATVLTLGVIGSVTAYAKEDSETTKSSPSFEHKHGDQGDAKKFISEKAEELGIKTDGKDTKVIFEEVQKAMTLKHAKELGIDTEGKEIKALQKEIWNAKLQLAATELGIDATGKDDETLAKEIREAQITKEAKELGISTVGKEFKALAKEVGQAKVLKKAKELGIETDDKEIFNAAEKLGIDTANKSARELMNEIRTNYTDKVEDLDLFPSKVEKDFFFDRPRDGKGEHFEGRRDHDKDDNGGKSQVPEKSNTQE
ncbi:hypothetical protein [Sporosarcina sp. FSL K6-5500]|uniref:hypothetical protein n=1 Tax=Sporosarcina sp. FSL K6-5500 TaxID=2921558 RepID=UPI0030F8786F